MDSLEELKTYCEDPVYLQKRKQVIIRDDSQLDEINDRSNEDESRTPGHKFMSNKASFIFNPLQNDVIKKANDTDTFTNLQSPKPNMSQKNYVDYAAKDS